MSDIKSKEWIRNYITLLIDEVKDLSVKERDSISFRRKIALKHDTFFEKFPGLMMIIVDQGSDFDLVKMEQYLNLMESVQTGEKDGEEVSKKIGQDYFDNYVAPNIDMDKENPK